MSEQLNPTGLDDPELVRRFKQTYEGEYFAELFQRHQKRIYMICYQVFKDSSLVEDLLQETFKKALEQIGSFDENAAGSNFARWLAKICRNLCLDELRKRRIRENARLAVKEARIEINGEASVLLRELEEELRGLKREYRVCYVLFYVEGYTYQEISRITGFSFDEVKTYIRAARRCLERKFK